MKLHDIKANTGSRKQRDRRGRGDSSGSGNFSGRGCKGQNARAGGGVRLGFEGGQTPLLRRTPKLKGFKRAHRTEYIILNLHQIEERYQDGETVSPATLFEKGLIAKADLPVKVLGRGQLTKKVEFAGVKLSKSVETTAGAAPKVKSASKAEAKAAKEQAAEATEDVPAEDSTAASAKAE